MRARTDKEALFWLIDELLVRWRATPKRYPFNRPDAIIPQTLIPEELRRDKETLATWYIGVCNQMKGRVASAEAFRGNLRIWENHPWFFNVREALWHSPQEMVDIYEKYLPIDRETNVRGLLWNYRLLDVHYDGSPLNLIKRITNYDEAERRLRNKRTLRERLAAGSAGEGMFGFQHKMVSMLVYFYDWERWFKKRFPYPSPADIHNFRIGFNGKALVVEGLEGDTIKDYEGISAPWRAAVMEYIIERNEDPVDVSDVLWLFSNVMCGNSPMTHTPREELPEDHSGMFEGDELPHFNGEIQFAHPRYRRDLEQTCLNCFLLDKCDYAIPARPYYNKGMIVLRRRPKIELSVDRSMIKEPVYEQPVEHPKLPFEHPAAAP